MASSVAKRGYLSSSSSDTRRSFVGDASDADSCGDDAVDGDFGWGGTVFEDAWCFFPQLLADGGPDGGDGKVRTGETLL